MIFTKLRLTGLIAIDLPIVGATPSDPFIVKQVDGLGPSEVDVFMSKAALQGGLYSGRRPQGRHVVFTIGLNPNYSLYQSVSNLREALYTLFDGSGDAVRIGLYNGDTEVAWVNGYVSNMDAAIFSKDPAVQVTLDCADPYFISPQTLDIVPHGGTAGDAVLNNPGTAPCGIKGVITLTADPGSYLVFQLGTKFIALNAPDLIAGDSVYFSTVIGDLYAKTSRPPSYTPTSIIGLVTTDSDWFQMPPGENTLQVFYLVGAALVPFTGYTWGHLNYTPQYRGV